MAAIRKAKKNIGYKRRRILSCHSNWGDKNVMNILWSVIMLGFYLVFMVMICMSPVFFSEHESGAVSLLLTTKYGKDRLVWAKIAASVSFAVLYLSIGMILAVIIIGLLLGFQGADLPVQLWNSVIPYHLTVGQACVWSAVVILLISIVITLFLLMCSARLHSSFAALVIGKAVMIVPAFLPMSKESGLWNHINYLFPIRVMDVKEMMGAFVSYAAGDCVIPYMGLVVIAYLGIGAAALLLIRKGFVRVR